MPPSRPIPDWPLPPNGAPRSRTKKQLTQTVPARSRALTRSARSGSPVTMVAARPNRVSLAMATAWSSSPNVCTVRTGPKTSSVTISEPAGTRRQDGRLVEQPAEVAVGTAAEGGGRAGGQGPPDEAVDALEMRPADQAGDVGGLVARVALDDRAGLFQDGREELLGD